MISKTLSLEALCAQESISLSTAVVTVNNVVIIPKRIAGRDLLSADFVPLIKKIRLEASPSHLANRDVEPEYYDFRANEYEIPLLIIKEAVLPVVLSLISAWIYNKLSEYRESKKKHPNNVKLQEPTIKARWYITESQEYFELEGPASEASMSISTFLQERPRKS
ncbi:MAG: hypothetical protein ABSD49_01790 [Candidatus Bathyarchaeia archaeon]